MKKLLFPLQILACFSLFAEEQNLPLSECPRFQQGDVAVEVAPLGAKTPAAYSYPGNICINRNWDVYVDGSYLYWQTNQEGLDLATTAVVVNFGGNYDLETFQSPENGFTVFQDFDYTSGFKVGLGSNLNSDNWVLDLEYTRLHQSTNTSQSITGSSDIYFSESGTYPATNVFNFTGWFFENYFSQGISALQFNSNWKLGLDWIDLTLSRPFYLGSKLTIKPSTGLRASWIKQELTISTSTAESIYIPGFTHTDVSKNHSHSWALGPRTVLEAHWLLGKGFRLEGNMGGSILFTQFTKLSHSETGLLVGSEFTLKNYNCLRPMAESKLGIGWGSYFSENHYHLDFSASYDFNYLWNQNMLKYMVNLNNSGIGSSSYDMFIQGLTIKARFDF